MKFFFVFLTVVFLFVLVQNPFLSIYGSDELSFLRKRAENKDRVCQYILGKRLFESAKKQKDLEEALKWLKRSAHQKYIPAIIFLARIYEKGKKVKLDFVESFKWYRIAKDLGSVIAYKKLSFLEKKELKGFLFFNTPIFSLNRFAIRYLFQKNGGKAVKLADDNKRFCDIFDSSSLFDGSDMTQICYLPDSKRLAFFEIRFPYKRNLQNTYLKKYYLSLSEKYGDPKTQGNIFIWIKGSIEILLWLEPKTNTVFLRYRDPKREKILIEYKRLMEKRKLIIPNI